MVMGITLSHALMLCLWQVANVDLCNPEIGLVLELVFYGLGLGFRLIIEPSCTDPVPSVQNLTITHKKLALRPAKFHGCICIVLFLF